MLTMNTHRKDFILLSALFAGCILSNSSSAQPRVSVNINVGIQPAWGPTGYDNVNYYYLPDIETYYYVPRHQFIYLDGGRWVFASSLPERCHSYDLYRGYKVVINDPRPYQRHEEYRKRYTQYREYYDRQPVLRDYRNEREYDDQDGPGHGHGRGHAYGHHKHHDKGGDD